MAEKSSGKPAKAAKTTAAKRGAAKPASDVSFPAGHGCEVGLHRSVAVPFRYLRIAA